MNSDAQTPKLTAVLDSNVLISGLAFSRGNPYEILNALRRGEIQAHISPFILEEVARNLQRVFQIPQPSIVAIDAFLRERCIVIDPPPTLSLDELSPEDNRVLDCAVQGQAQYLVTGDREFLRLGVYQGVGIINPREFLGLVRQES